MGQLIAANVLRCPKCKSLDYKLLVCETPSMRQ
jgi:hypothetical protein